MSAARHARPASAPRKVTFTQVLGELLITVSVLLFSFAFYEAYWTNVEAAKQQDDVSHALDDKWSKKVNPRQKLTPELGEAFARMYIPTFGSDFAFAIVEGTTDEDLLRGPGRYVDSQMPGDAGNFAIAGHRVGKGAPFNDLGNLEVCDAIIVETRNSWEIYRVLPIEVSGQQREAAAAKCFSQKQVSEISSGQYAGIEGRHITLPGNYSVVQPLPGLDVTQVEPGLEGLMTMTTCHPQFSNAERMIVHAMKVRSEPKTGGNRPVEFEES